MFFKKAKGNSSKEWELFFNSILSILYDCESVPHLFAWIVGEGNAWHVFRTGCGMQQNLSLAVDQGDSESEAFLYELLQN